MLESYISVAATSATSTNLPLTYRDDGDAESDAGDHTPLELDTDIVPAEFLADFDAFVSGLQAHQIACVTGTGSARVLPACTATPASQMRRGKTYCALCLRR